MIKYNEKIKLFLEGCISFLIIPVIIAIGLWAMSYKISRTIEEFYKVEYTTRNKPINIQCISIEDKLVCKIQ